MSIKRGRVRTKREKEVGERTQRLVLGKRSALVAIAGRTTVGMGPTFFHRVAPK